MECTEQDRQKQDEMIQAVVVRIGAAVVICLSWSAISYVHLLRRRKRRKRTPNMTVNLANSIAASYSIVRGILYQGTDGIQRIYYDEIRKAGFLRGTDDMNVPSASAKSNKNELRFVSDNTTPFESSFTSELDVVPEGSNSEEDEDEDEDEEYDYEYEHESEVDHLSENSFSSDEEEAKCEIEQNNQHVKPVHISENPTLNPTINSIMAKQGELFYLRVCDLSLKISETISEIGDSLTVSRKVHPMVPPLKALRKEERLSLTWLDFGDDLEMSESAISALLNNALSFISDDEKGSVQWTPEKSSRKTLSLPKQDQVSFMESQVLVWNGKVKQAGKYGSDYPAVKYKGFVNSRPKILASLLLDSKRVKEYNDSSLGREDVHVFEKGWNDRGVFGGETKVVRNKTQIPIIGKTHEATSLMHGRKLSSNKNGDTYIVITRAVSSNKNGGNAGEIVLGANLIQPVEGNQNKSLITSISHVSGLPSFLAARIYNKAANDFMSGIRQATRRDVAT